MQFTCFSPPELSDVTTLAPVQGFAGVGPAGGRFSLLAPPVFLLRRPSRVTRRAR